MEHIISDDSVTHPQVGDTYNPSRESVAEECRISNFGVNERGED